MISNKQAVQRLIEIFVKKEINQVVISPGSRNAPLIQTFYGEGSFNMYSVPDERTAGFIALGMAMKTRQPVILNCTSGSALLNYGPAIVEAYYQNIPLIILSADRPRNRIDQGHGQSMRQDNVFHNYIKASLQIEELSVKEPWFFDSKVNEVLLPVFIENKGPVHINFHLDEPLYEFQDPQAIPVRIINYPDFEKTLKHHTLRRLNKTWNECKRVMVLVGQHPPCPMLNECLEEMVNKMNVVVLTEHTSNIKGDFFRINNIDRCIFPLDKNKWEIFKPDLLISFGKEIVSKKIKKLLFHSSEFQHWHVGVNVDHRDTFGGLTELLRLPPHSFLKSIREFEPKTRDYNSIWESRSIQAKRLHDQYLEHAEWSDLKSWEFIAHHIPVSTVLHLGNSASIRYSLLFDLPTEIDYYANRGVSGIEGCTSTALGYAMQESERPVWLVTGDIAFLYDQNAFWMTARPTNLKVIVINNGGGGIFRFIDGPSNSEISDPYLETNHSDSILTNLKNSAVDLFSVQNSRELQEIFPTFATSQGTSVLEIRTPREKNDLILKEYFNMLKI